MSLATKPSLLATPSLSGPSDRRALWRLAFRERPVWQRAMKLGLSAGLLQAAINQGDHWASGAVSSGVVVKSILSPLIGFALALVSAAATWVQRSPEQIKS